MKLNQLIDEVGDRYHVTTTIAGTSAAEDQLISDHGEPIIEVGGNFTGDVTRPGETAPVVEFEVGNAEATANVVDGEITSYTVTDSGAGYSDAPDVEITGGGGSGATAHTTVKAVGAVIANGGTTRYRATSVAVAAAGTLYQVGDKLTVVGGTAATLAVFNVDSVDGGGAVTGVSVDEEGKYDTIPSNPVTTTTDSVAGSGATINVTWTSRADYQVNDTITLAGGTNVTPTILTVDSVTDGVITAVTITVAGNYSATPTNPAAQASTSGDGEGAMFTISWGIHSVLPDDVGSDYFLVPTPLDFTFPTKSRRLITDFPDKRVFDLADDIKSDLMAKLYAETIKARIEAALATLRSLQSPFEGETLTTI